MSRRGVASAASFPRPRVGTTGDVGTLSAAQRPGLMDAHQSSYGGAGVTDAVFQEHRQGVDDASAREQSGDLEYQQQQQLLQQQQQQQHEAVSHYAAQQASAGYIAGQSDAHLQVQIPCLCNSGHS